MFHQLDIAHATITWLQVTLLDTSLAWQDIFGPVFLDSVAFCLVYTA